MPPPDPSNEAVSRRSVLGSVGASVTATAIPRGIRGYGDVRGTPEEPGTITVDGETIHLTPVVGTCKDLSLVMTVQGPIDQDGQANPNTMGIHDPRWFINGEPIRPHYQEDGTFTFPVERLYEPRLRELDSGGYELVPAEFDATYEVDITVTVLDWRPVYAELTPGCIEAWCDLFEQTVSHELRHVEDAREIESLANQKGGSYGRSRPSVPVDAEDRDDESVLESKRAELRDLVREDLATMADWIANEARRRREEVHEQSSYAEMSCDECPRCADRWHATLGDVDAWDLHVEYQYEAHLDWEGDEYHWARNQTWSEFRLERVPSPTDGISSFLGDVAMKLDGLVGEESDDPVPNRGPLLVYRGGGRIAGSYEEERHWGDGDVTRFAASGDTERREDATLEVSRDDNEYELDWKAQSTVEGTVSRPGPDGDRTDRGPVPLYSGFWAMTQSEGKFTSFAPVDEGGNLAAPDLELPRWSIHDCHMVPSESITQDLYRRTDALTARRGRGLSPEADGQYAGQETVTWTLRPATVRGVTPRRPDC